LNDLLTSVEAYPHSVTNREGVSGARSADGLAVIAKALAAHPGARVFLIQYGTNDSHGTLPVPSGLGKNPGDPGYAGSFKDNMHRIVTIVLAAGKVPALAKVPITLGPCSACTPFKDPTVASRNLLIQQYNAAIDELVAHFALTVVPPDFYRYFNEHRDQFSDRLHPNGAGYRAMADLWQSSLSDR
jgi:lysophospholipase L1-like esterase